MRFPFPGQLPGASRKVAWSFGLLHGLCAISLLYPYMGPVFHLVPLGLLLFLIRHKLPAEARVPYRFLVQRALLLGLVTLVCWLVLFNLNLHGWTVLYFSLLPLFIADTMAAFKGGVGLFFWRGRDD
jgi:hypothetical protein